MTEEQEHEDLSEEEAEAMDLADADYAEIVRLVKWGVL
jgi:hypothetical protein